MNFIRMIRNYFILKSNISNNQNNYPTFQLDKTYETLSQERIVSCMKTISWADLLSTYIFDSIDIYIKWLKNGMPQNIMLVFSQEYTYNELEPKIYLNYDKNSILLDYEKLRHGKLGKISSEIQKQCVRAAESDYIEFRENIVGKEKLRENLSSVTSILESRFHIPVNYKLVTKT